MDAESSARLLLFGAVALILVAATGFIAFGYWYSEVRPEGRTVLKADGIEVSYAAMKRRMEYELFLTPQYIQLLNALPEVAYANLLNELTFISRADDAFGITATEDEINAEIRQRAGVPEDADQRVFADRFRDVLTSSNLTEGEYRRVAQAAVLQNKLLDKFAAEAPAEIEQVKVEMISVDDLAGAQSARDRVVAGEDWATVAREVSTQPDVDTNGGLQPYEPAGVLNQAVNDWAFQAAINEISEPLSVISGQGPYFVARLLDRSMQPLREEQKTPYATRQLEQWLADTQATMDIVRRWELNDQRAALSEIDLTPAEQNQPVVVPSVVFDTPAADATVPTESSSPAAGDDGAGPDPSGAPQPDDGP